MDKKNLKVTIIVPTMDEIDGMRWFMPRIKKDWYDELIIVDGGSTDGTIEYCGKNGYPIYIQSGRGLPNAYDEAFKRSNMDIIVTVTPDGNSIPELIPTLVGKIREGYDMAVASRYLNDARSYDDDIFTKIGNKIFTRMINFLFRAKHTDTLVGLRAYNRDAICRMHLYDQDRQGWIKSKFFLMNSWETGSSIRAAKLKLKICEIPGDEPRRIGGRRKLSIIKNGFGVLFQIIHEFVIGNNFRNYSRHNVIAKSEHSERRSNPVRDSSLRSE